MVHVGQMNKLVVMRQSDFGLSLDDGQGGEVLLPKRSVPTNWSIGDALEVFVYADSKGRRIADTDRPKALIGEFALLQVKETTGVGAFLDWGIAKDLLVPFREQRVPMKQGQSYLVHVYLDRISGRVVATSKLDRYLGGSGKLYNYGEAVDLIVWQRTDLGYKAIINNESWGMIFHNDIFQPLERGQRLKGFIKNVRPDGLIDLSLQKPGYGKVTDMAPVILDCLKNENGFLPITDKTAPEEINARFGVSKKTFKKAIGALYRKRLISVEPDGIRLNTKP